MVMLESFSLILCVLYFALVLLSVTQLIRIVWNRHMLFGWQGLFLIFVFFWGAVRGFFFLFIDELDEFDDAWVIYLLYWLPINIQFATFSLLVLFYANIIYKCTDSAWWDKYRAFFVAVHVVINVTVLSLILTAVVLTSAVDQSDNTLFGNSWQNMVTALISAAIFTVLITVLGYYGLKIAPLLKSGHVKIPFQPKRTSNIPILVVTFMVFIIFLSRAIFNVLSAFGVVSLPVESGSSWMDFATLVVFLWWDILPILLVIMLFWRIPSSGAIRMPLLPAAGYSINGSSSGDPTLYKQPEKSSQLFDNPLRYDSPPTDGVTGLNSVLRHSLLDTHYSLTNSPYSPYSTESPHSYPSTPPTTPSTTPQQQHQVTDDSNMFGKKKKKGKSKLQVAHGGRNDSDEEHHM